MRKWSRTTILQLLSSRTLRARVAIGGLFSIPGEPRIARQYPSRPNGKRRWMRRRRLNGALPLGRPNYENAQTTARLEPMGEAHGRYSHWRYRGFKPDCRGRPQQRPGSGLSRTQGRIKGRHSPCRIPVVVREKEDSPRSRPKALAQGMIFDILVV
jgi:hypothetical protein